MTQIPNGRTEADQKLVLAKRQLEKLSIEFHKLLEDKTLIENKTQGQLNMETDLGLRLIQAANEVDVLKYPEPEGTFTLLILLVHISLIMRDKNNKLDHKVMLLQNEIAKFQKQIKDMSSAGQRNG